MHSSFTSAQTVVLCEKKGYYPCEGYLDTFSSKSTVNFFTGVLAAARVCSWQHFTSTYHLLTSSVAITVGCAKNNPVRGCFEVFSRAGPSLLWPSRGFFLPYKALGIAGNGFSVKKKQKPSG